MIINNNAVNVLSTIFLDKVKNLSALDHND